MGCFGVKRCFCILFTLAILASAACNTIPLSGDVVVLAAERRSLMASLDDYSAPTANRGHDPPSRPRGRGRSPNNGGGQRGRKA